MSKKFYAENRETSKRWTKDPRYTHQYLVMYDSGYLAVVTEHRYEGATIIPLDTKQWKTIIKGTNNIPPMPVEKPYTKEVCKHCRGEGQTSEIVDHDHEYNSVWALGTCYICDGTGFLIKYT